MVCMHYFRDEVAKVKCWQMGESQTTSAPLLLIRGIGPLPVMWAVKFASMWVK